jgi:hypothetical protein
MLLRGATRENHPRSYLSGLCGNHPLARAVVEAGLLVRGTINRMFLRRRPLLTTPRALW